MRTPNLKKFTPEEEKELRKRAIDLFRQGKEDEGNSLLDALPVPAEYLQTLKEQIGIDELVDSGLNLSNAVEVYGENWLVS